MVRRKGYTIPLYLLLIHLAKLSVNAAQTREEKLLSVESASPHHSVCEFKHYGLS